MSTNANMNSKEDYNGGDGKHLLSNLPLEIWINVGKQMHTLQLFKSLGAIAQTCKFFSDIFVPILYSRRIIYVDERWQSNLPVVNNNSILPSTLIHAKDLEFHFTKSIMILDGITGYEGFDEFVAKVLSRTPNLRSFRWSDQSLPGSSLQNLPLRERGNMEKLRRNPKLRHLWIEFSTDLNGKKYAEANRWCSLEGFCNLTSLNLHNFYGNNSQITDELAQCLVNCPNLKSLGISLGSHYDWKTLGGPVVKDETDNFLEQLCSLYGDRYDSRPLDLHTLRLGFGASPYAPKMRDNQNYLQNLVCTKGLLSLEFYNGLWVEHLEGVPKDVLPIDFQLLEGCESLTHLSMTGLEGDVIDWLSNRKRFSIRTMSTASYSHFSDEISFKLDLPNLSTLVTHNQAPRPVNEDGDVPPLDPSSVLHHAVSKYTILDNLLNKGSQLTSLTLCIHYEIQWENFCSQLANLNLLTHLRLNDLFRGGISLPIQPSLSFKNATSYPDRAYYYAQEISKLCPSLRYLMISFSRKPPAAWEIIPGGDGVRDRRFRTLSVDELNTFELFSDDFDELEKPTGLLLESQWEKARPYPYLRWAPHDAHDEQTTSRW
ncbi:7a724407-af52-4e39-9517-cf7d409124ef [Sclerotinia trifoliorum]|uniref:7a724407-af52-4e39-9517-cf7d409124ef n=1 Tax=Sclerotinia trifoliorum TaxID=28548 RepID=A0A8H2VT53_9HELO|nr:7a724407-af52-4e39-9517-cf7d409124ef [Sclerotinia trifoliorum]